VAAVISSLLYTFLLTYESIWCWLFAGLSSTLYLIICFRRKIYAEWALQLFYLGSAAYGFWNWGSTFETLASLSWQIHLVLVGGGSLTTFVTASLLQSYTDSAIPTLDSFTTIFSIIATILMINFYPENWVYWIIIDAASVYLYFKRGLKLTALLFVLYTLLSINGFIQWNGILS
jgi:nicotinamide mononucleotide transporter